VSNINCRLIQSSKHSGYSTNWKCNQCWSAQAVCTSKQFLFPHQKIV